MEGKQTFNVCDIIAYWQMDESSPGGSYLDSVGDHDAGGTGSLSVVPDGIRNNAVGFDGAVSTGGWHHVAFVRTANSDGSGTTRIYIDGNLEGEFSTVTYNAGFWHSTSEISIGCLIEDGTPSYHFSGDVDEVAISDRALSQGDIQSNIAAIGAGEDYCGGSFPESQFAPFPEDTVSLWDLNQGFADAFGDNDGTSSAAPTPDPTGINGSHAFDSGRLTGIDIDADRSFDWTDAVGITVRDTTTLSFLMLLLLSE